VIESNKGIPLRQIRAHQSETSLVVYQAYSHQIADAALKAGRFTSPFRLDRMTWIKPSFLWMAYRSGWGTKPGQERILAITIIKDGFEWAVANSCLSHYEQPTYPSHTNWQARLNTTPVRIQWDPERGLKHEPLSHRSIQVGLSREAIRRYARDWTTNIEDQTSRFREIETLARTGQSAAAKQLLPNETPYTLTPELASTIGANI